MSAVMFDTHAFVRELTEAGMLEPQAEALARTQTMLINETLATKQDLKDFEIRLKHEMKELEWRLTMRLGSMIVVAIGVVAALVKLL